MGRVKIAMEFISKEKARNNTYIKRKKGLLKKCHEFSILCNVPICIIIYPYKDGKQPLQPEVYSFNGDSESTASFSPSNLGSSSSVASDPKIAREIIDRYLRVPNEEKIKRSVNLYDMFGEWTKLADQELYKLRHKNALAKYPFSCISNEFSVDQLMELLLFLDQKIEFVKQRIAMIKDNNHNQEATTMTMTTTTTTGLVPYFEPTPISCFMNPNIGENNNDDDHHHHHHHQFGGFNQFPLFDYPIINNNDDHNQDCYHQIVPFNQQSALFPHHHQVLGATKMDEDHGGSNSNLFMYNITGGVGVGPMFYDQRSGFGDSVGATSSYGGGLPMSMPLQLPMLNPDNVSLPRQRQYHTSIFYN